MQGVCVRGITKKVENPELKDMKEDDERMWVNDKDESSEWKDSRGFASIQLRKISQFSAVQSVNKRGQKGM